MFGFRAEKQTWFSNHQGADFCFISTKSLKFFFSYV